MSTATDLRPAGTDDRLDPDLLHTACCETDEIALCGIDISGHEWDQHSTAPECEPCTRLIGFDCETKACPVQALRDLAGP